MRLITRAGVAVFAVVLGFALVAGAADDKASKAGEAKGEAAEAQKAAKSEAASAAKAEAKDAKEAKDTVAKTEVKLVLPWSKLTTLSAEQKEKIHAIHEKALAEMSAIRKRENTEIRALLTDEQKSELREIAAQQKKADAEKKTLKKADDKQDAAPKADEKKSAKDAAECAAGRAGRGFTPDVDPARGSRVRYHCPYSRKRRTAGASTGGFLLASRCIGAGGSPTPRRAPACSPPRGAGPRTSGRPGRCGRG